MTEGNRWPAKKPRGSGSKSNFDKYRPAVAQAMQEEGLETFKDLWGRIEWLLLHPAISEMYGLKKEQASNSVHYLLLKKSMNSGDRVRMQSGKFSRYREIIALALGRDVVELFGANTHARKLPKSYKPEDSKTITDPFDYAARAQLRRKLPLALRTLPPRQEYLLRARNGMRCHKHSLGEMTELWAPTNKQSVSNIEDNALERLRRKPPVQKLREFYSDTEYSPPEGRKIVVQGPDYEEIRKTRRAQRREALKSHKEWLRAQGIEPS